MQAKEWEKEINMGVTVCDTEGIIIYMNDIDIQKQAKHGGKQLIGKSLYDCHNAVSTQKIKELIANKGTNSYTIEKNGIKKFIHQTPWFENSKLGGLVEFSIEIPFDMPHFIRK